MTARLARAVRELDNKPPCEQAEATRELTAEVRRLRLSLRAGIRQVQPACSAVRGLCNWWKKRGPWLLAALPGVLLAIGAIQPSAAKALAELIKAFGAG